MNDILAITTHKQLKVKLQVFSMLCFITLFVTFFSLSSLASNSNAPTLQNNKLYETKPRVLIVISSDEHGYWLPEVLEPYHLLQQAGFIIDIASPLGGEGKSRGGLRLSSTQKAWLVQSSLVKKLLNSLTINQVQASDYQAIYFAGGSGPMFDFIDNESIHKLTAKIYESGGIVSADCHGIAGLLKVKLSNGTRLISGKKLTAKANHEEGR